MSRLNLCLTTLSILSIDNKLTSTKCRHTGLEFCASEQLLHEEPRNRWEADERAERANKRAKLERRNRQEAATHIISHLQRIEEAPRAFNLGEGIIFENHTDILSDSSEEV